MKNNIIKIQEYLIKNDIDAFIVFHSDDHGSEYIVDYYKVRAFLCGFSGSAGTLLITKNSSMLWTDGRYFLQAEEQLKNTDTKLMKIGEENVPSLISYLSTLNTNLKVAFDFKLATISFINDLKNKINNLTLINEEKLIDEIWINRPSLPKSKMYLIDETNAGESYFSKVNRLKEYLKENEVNAALISSLDDIAWLFNLRGNDIQYNPVNLSYAFISLTESVLYVNKEKIDNQIKKYFTDNNIIVKSYEEVYEDIKKYNDWILIDANKTNYYLDTLIKQKKIGKVFPTTAFKAIKNNVEIKNIKKVHIYDGIALIKFMYYLKSNFLKEKMSELSLINKLETYRQENKKYIQPSFNTICGFNENGAIVHYSANEKTNKIIDKSGLLLVDSGGQYFYGTTDITRTFALGKISKQIKKDYTIVLKSHIALSSAIFIKGVRGVSLDILARKPLFDNYLDYKHGTGHGVGYLLNVHEGPQNIRYGINDNYISEIIMPGMITSNEPGLYKTNKYGIRHENLILCVEKNKNEYGTFLGFEPLTLVPFDLDAIDFSMLSKHEIKWLNNYHKMVYNKIAKYLNEKERKFLKRATREIKNGND